jgi:transcription initiation factor IIE alpha subunit
MGERVVAQLSNSAGEEEQKYMFYCEGCKENHMFDERWTFNGDCDRPTFLPSLL